MAAIGTSAPIRHGRPLARHGRGLSDERRWRWLMLLPALILMLSLAVLPLANMGALSFHSVSWSGGQAVWTPAGLQHYLALPADALLRPALRNTTIFAVAAVSAEMLLGFVLALLCTRITRGRVFYRTVFILPILIPGIVIGAMWRLMYNFDFGLVNQVLGLIGFTPHDWLGSPGTALLSVILVDIWHWTPFCFLLLLAGLESLPQDIYEAAKIDGATAWQELAHVTLPLMVPTLVVTLIFRLIVAFKVFDEVYLLTAGGPGTSTEVLSYTIYQRFFAEDHVGYGSAMSVVVIFLISLLLVLALAARRNGRARA